MYLLELSSCLFVPCLKKFITILSCTCIYAFLHSLFQRTLWVRLFLCPSSYIPGINIQLYETFPDFCTVSTTRWLQRDNLWYFPCLNKVLNVRNLSIPKNNSKVLLVLISKWYPSLSYEYSGKFIFWLILIHDV